MIFKIWPRSLRKIQVRSGRNKRNQIGAQASITVQTMREIDNLPQQIGMTAEIGGPSVDVLEQEAGKPRSPGDQPSRSVWARGIALQEEYASAARAVAGSHGPARL
jgi:hypothetical protein